MFDQFSCLSPVIIPAAPSHNLRLQLVQLRQVEISDSEFVT